MKKNLLLTAAILALTPFTAHAASEYSYGTRADTYSNSAAATVADTSPSAGYSSDSTFLGMEGPYVQFQGGWNKTDDEGAADYDSGWVAGVAAGGKMPWARGEVEVSYRNNDVDTVGGGDVDSWALMGNAYWDIETGSAITPYLGVGIGAAHVDFDTVGGDDSWEFAYQGMAGASFAVAPETALGVEYRYFATTEVEGADYDNHAVLATLRRSF
jgi:opacity protein-like surface antigen